MDQSANPQSDALTVQHAQDAAHVAAAAARLGALPQLSTSEEYARVVHGLCQVSVRLLGADPALARDLRRALRASTGLSPEMIEWGLTTTLSSVRPDVLDALARESIGTRGVVPIPASLVAVVLAGNVFSAAVRAMFLPLLTGAPVLIKASSRDDVLPRHLLRALHGVDPELAQRCEVVTFARDDASALDALLAQAEVVSIYGDDDTTRTIAGLARAGSRIVQHGHGLSASWVTTHALETPAALRDCALRLALDIAAYDQRGCLSPHMIFVDHAGAGMGDARTLIQVLVDEALPELQRLLPAGRSDTVDQALALQWRAAAQVRGALLERPGFAVSYEADHAPRPSPGGRLVSVYDCSGPDRLADRLASFGSALKCIGVAGPRPLRQRLAQAIRRVGPARICRAGEMQTPPFDTFADGQPPLAGLLSFIDAD